MTFVRTRPELGYSPDFRVGAGQVATIRVPLGRIEVRVVDGAAECRIFSEVLEGEPVVFPAEAAEIISMMQMLWENLPKPIPLDHFEERNDRARERATQDPD